jgi:hypothetical protein
MDVSDIAVEFIVAALSGMASGLAVEFIKGHGINWVPQRLPYCGSDLHERPGRLTGALFSVHSSHRHSSQEPGAAGESGLPAPVDGLPLLRGLED